jgi:hypothetical protein
MIILNDFDDNVIFDIFRAVYLEKIIIISYSSTFIIDFVYMNKLPCYFTIF